MMPVFIGGCPRSGTTLLGAMLGSHSRCVLTPESEFTVYPLASRFVQNGKRLSESTIDEALGTWRFRAWDISVAKSELTSLFDSVSLAPFIEYLVEAYARKHGSYPADYWIDHTPQNITWTSTRLKQFPNAKFIHLVRDGRAVAASIMKLIFGANTPKVAADYWKSSLAFGLAAEGALPKDRILRVKYETLVRDTQETLEKVCDFCGFDFEREMLSGTGFQVPKYARKQHRLVAGLPRADRIDGWKRELKPRQVQLFEYHTADLLLHLGYELEYGGLVEQPGKLEVAAMEIKELARRGVNLCLRAIKWKRFGQ